MWLGDDLTFVASVDPASLGLELVVLDTRTFGTVNSVGDTGRFTDATGSVQVFAPHQDGPLTLAGLISYHASKRSAR